MQLVPFNQKKTKNARPNARPFARPIPIFAILNLFKGIQCTFLAFNKSGPTTVLLLPFAP
jgi:hypothetical protein